MKKWHLISFLFLFAFSIVDDGTYEESSFTIEKGSQITIFGTSNVAKFSCCCESTFDPKQFSYTVGNAGYIQFNGAEITVNSTDIDCGNKAINKDMQETLESEKYPFIHVVLKEIYQPSIDNVSNTKSVQLINAVAEITITDITQSSMINVEAQYLGKDRFNFSSTTVLALSDFGLEAPKPLLGLVKVDDNIVIDFDLYVNLKTT